MNWQIYRVADLDFADDKIIPSETLDILLVLALEALFWEPVG